MHPTSLFTRLLLVVLAALSTTCNRLGASNAVGSETQAPPPIARPEALDLRRVWSGSGAFNTMSPSPDGRYMTDIDWDTGDLAVVELETGKRRRVTDKGPWSKSNDYAEWSVFAPDGQRIAYSWFSSQARGYEVRTIRTDGSDMRTIFPRKPDVAYAAVADWSRDGASILVIVARADRSTQIGILSATDGAYTALKTNDWRQPQMAVFSPDGRYIAYDLFRPQDEATGKAPAKDIFLLAVDGSREMPLVTTPGINSLLGWLPDGRGILYHTRTNDSRALWALAVANGQPVGRPQLVRSDVWQMLPFGFSRDAFIYGASVERPQIHIVDVDLANGRVVTEPTPIGDPGEGVGHDPAWSPDGKMVAYLTSGPGPLVIRSATGEFHREIPLPLSNERRARWTKDGTAVLVYGVDREGRRGIHRLDLRAGTMKLLLGGSPSAETEGMAFWALSPDGNTVYYRSQRLQGETQFTGAGGPMVVAHDLRTAETREIPNAVPWGRVLSASPDGKLIAYTMQSRDFTEFGVMVVSTSGGSPREVYHQRGGSSLGNRGAIEWAPDSRSILIYSAPVEGPGGIWQVPLDGGAARLLLDDRHLTPLLQGTRGRPLDFRLSPDGRRLAYQAGRDRGEIWMMSGFSAAMATTSAGR